VIRISGEVVRMDINRHVDYGDVAAGRVRECLDKLEAAKSFRKGIDLGTPVVNRLTIQDMIMALVSAEQSWSGEEPYDVPEEVLSDGT